MKSEELKVKIIEANKAYRIGDPIMSDQQFDDLVESYQKLVTPAEYEAFRNSLHESKGKVKHPFVMGSLDKMKYEEPENLFKFYKRYITHGLNVSAKIDGISCRLHYTNGKLVSASTRGDGYEGEDITDKIKHVKLVPQSICLDPKEIDIRGELVILKDDFARMTGFKNPRNAAAGIMNRKDWNAADIRNISFIAYTILDANYTKEEQFGFLNAWGFTTAWNTTVKGQLDRFDANELAAHLYEMANKNFEYETDGLVICDSRYYNETAYRPDACVAFKINQLVGETKVIDVSFDGPSKDGLFTPVAIVEPIDLGGATIERASLHNLDVLAKLGIKYGSKVKLMKSGDVIPKITEVIENDAHTRPIEPPTVCPICGTELVRDADDINYRCPNHNCKGQLIHRTAYFIKKLDVAFASEATLENLGIYTYADLISFKANPKYKSQVKLAEELYNKVFTKSAQELLAVMNYEGIGETTVNKIIEFYTLDAFINKANLVGLPDGVGMVTLNKFKQDFEENMSYVNLFLADSRYHYQKPDNTNKVPKNGMSVCFTGSLNTMSRSEAQKLAESKGFEVKSGVSKGLTYLVTNDPYSGSSKNVKAQKLGTKLIDENEFIKLMNPTKEAEDLLNDL